MSVKPAAPLGAADQRDDARDPEHDHCRRPSRESRGTSGGVVVMSVDDALALAGQVLADYEASGAGNASGLDLLWRDRLARALRELAAAVSSGHVTPVSGRPTAVRETRPGSRLCRVPNALARIVGGWAG